MKTWNKVQLMLSHNMESLRPLQSWSSISRTSNLKPSKTLRGSLRRSQLSGTLRTILRSLRLCAHFSSRKRRKECGWVKSLRLCKAARAIYSSPRVTWKKSLSYLLRYYQDASVSSNSLMESSWDWIRAWNHSKSERQSQRTFNSRIRASDLWSYHY